MSFQGDGVYIPHFKKYGTNRISLGKTNNGPGRGGSGELRGAYNMYGLSPGSVRGSGMYKKRNFSIKDHSKKIKESTKTPKTYDEKTNKRKCCKKTDMKFDSAKGTKCEKLHKKMKKFKAKMKNGKKKSICFKVGKGMIPNYGGV